ncbi:MAG TPA: oxidoreductase-like domain-containing protein [Burkholderiales bacterium]|nr:oxidoreductase-like domain-containing protein [Burkholderiales bacterium]
MSLAESLAIPLADALSLIDRLQAEAHAKGLALPDAPEPIDPQTCCGRGCYPCMYTYYFNAVDAWQEQARQRLA